jgi:hypothetical protein
VHEIDPLQDGNAVAMTISSDNEIWLASSGVQALFGFNPATGSWDRTIQLSVVPTVLSRLAALQKGSLVIDGVTFDGAVAAPAISIVSTGAKSSTFLGAQVADFAVISGDEVVYTDRSRNIAKLSLAGGASIAIAQSAPLAGVPILTADSTGHVWFSLLAADGVGVGNVDVASGVVTAYLVPQAGSTPGDPGFFCPPIPSCQQATQAPIFDPGIEAITLDSNGDVWVTTSVSGSGDPNVRTSLSPLYELYRGA